MAYKHQAAKDATAKALVEIFKLATDQVKDETQILQYFMNLTAAISAAQPVFLEEDNKGDAKFIGKVIAEFADLVLDEVDEDEVA